LGVRVVRRSALDQPCAAEDWDILLVDAVGELRWWWGLAELALVGGSFGSRGGQNMLEPAAYGARVAFGPNTSNFREIVRPLLAAEAAWELPSLEALLPWLAEQLETPASGQARARRAVELVRSHQGATERTLQRLLQLLGGSHRCLHNAA
jgi:3-deoxy-D-manno-octulosonic-acid transferase